MPQRESDSFPISAAARGPVDLVPRAGALMDTPAPRPAAILLGPAPRRLTPALEAFVAGARVGRVRWWVAGLAVGLLAAALGPSVCTFNRTLSFARSAVPDVTMPAFGGVPALPRGPFGSPVVPGMPISGAFDWAQSLVWTIAGGIVACFVLAFGALLLGLRILGQRKRRKWRFVLENGSVMQAVVTGNLVDYSIRVNRAPRRRVRLQIDGSRIEFSTFDPNFANLFEPGKTLEVIYHPRHPDAVLPTSLLPVGP
jgi:hypothetical protein